MNQGLNIAKAGADLFAELQGNTFKNSKKGFEQQKVVNIATASIDTFMGVNKALGSAPPPVNFVTAAAVLTAGLANVAKIANTKWNSNSSGGSSVSSSSTSAASRSIPNLDVNPANSQSLVLSSRSKEFLESVKLQRVVVVETDVTSTQSRVAMLKNAATF
jgi:hypothetical protein